LYDNLEFRSQSMLNYDIADKPIRMTRSLILNAYKVSTLTFYL